jgi:murein DD-endopeptidase MepM/ murein hydrolase activator NlpD
VAVGAVVVAIAAVIIVLALRESPDARAPAVALPSGGALRAGESPKLDVVPRPKITARVLVNGAAKPDVQVWITDGSKPVIAHAFTNRDGQVVFDELPRGPFELWAAAAGLASAPARVDDGANIEIALEPAANVRGEVAAEGFVAPTSTVTLVPLDGDHVARIAPIDSSGRFALEGIPMGRWRVETTVPGHVQAAEQVLRVGAPEEQVAVRMLQTGTLAGTVVDSHGTPVANATIVLRDQAGEQRPLALASTNLRWVHPLAGTRQMPANSSGRFSAPRPGARPTECGRGHCGIDIGSVRGTIVHAAADGEVAAIFAESRTEAGKLVTIHHGGGLKTMYMHLDEIRPGLEVGQTIRAGEPVGTLGSTGFVRSIPHVHFALTHEYGRTWYLDPEPLLRHAVVLREARAYDPFEPSTTRDPLEAKPVVQRITTDAHGGFRIADVAPGSYVVGAFASEYAPGASPSFAVRGGEETRGITVRLDAGIAVKGIVLGRDGPLAGAVVMAGAGFGETAHKIATTFTDKNGRFVLRALAGKITLSAQAPLYGEAEKSLVVDERTREQTLQLTIENARLRGQVLAPDGGAAAGVSVRVIQGPTRRRGITDAQGKFTLDRVATGSYTLELTSPEFPTKRIDVETEKWREVRLDVGGGARVLVRDAAGTPLANVRVDVSGPGTAHRMTDAKGIAELRGLVPGEWRVTAKAAGYAAGTQNVTIRPERVLRDVTLELARSAAIAGTIRDRYGRRVAGARVSLGGATAKTDADGNFRIADAPVGAGVIEAEFEGARGTLPIELLPGSERVALTIELQ